MTDGVWVRENTKAYRDWYNRGWRYSAAGSSLDRADAKGYTRNEAWLDGFHDEASGRAKWHRLVCPNHDTCGQ